MASVNFLYRSTKDKSQLNLRLLYRHEGKDFVIGGKTKLIVSKEYWNKQHTQKRPKNINVANKQVETNKELNLIENHILNAFNNTDINDVSKDWLKRHLDSYYNPQEEKQIPVNLIDYIEFYINYRKNELKDTSIKKFRVIKHKLERLELKRNSRILIKNVNDNFKNEFVNFSKEDNYSQNTIQRDFTFIKTFCKHARFLGLETHSQLDSLRIDREKAPKIYLTEKELEKIEQKENLEDYLDNARDWLIISCYTGQRISDFLRFSSKMIREEDGKKLLEFTQQKTGKFMTVPIHPKVEEILKKRDGNFPREISHQKYNDYIKLVCKKAKINQIIKGSKLEEVKEKSGKYRKVTGMYKKHDLVTSHIGRRSFASNFYGKIPTTYLIYITGHSSETMFLNYIGKSNKDLAMEIGNYF